MFVVFMWMGMNVCAVCCADELHSKGCVSVHAYMISVLCVLLWYAHVWYV